MIIRNNELEVSRLENFKGGEKHLEARMFFDGTNRILTRARLIPGASIGLHTHDDSCEVIFILDGCGSILEDGTKKEDYKGTAIIINYEEIGIKVQNGLYSWTTAIYKIKDYGKTWALTKEELEK